MLWLYRRVVFGPMVKPEIQALKRLDSREILIFVPLTILVLWLGVYPASLLDLMNPVISTLTADVTLPSAAQTALR